jgi:hypothetical protein
MEVDLFRSVQVTVIDRDTDRVLCLTTGKVAIVRRDPTDGRGTVHLVRFEDPSE